MTKILILSWEFPPVVVGGLGRHVYELSKALVSLGHQVVVLSRAPFGTTPAVSPISDTIVDGVRVVRVPEDPLSISFDADLVSWTLSLGHALVRAGLELVKTFSPDVVHAHDWLVAAPAITLAEHCSIPLVTTVHATEAGRHDGWIGTPTSVQVHSAERWLVRSSDAVICCSQSMKEETTTLFGPFEEFSTSTDSGHHPVVIPNGIDLSTWKYQPAQRCAVPPRLLFVGRLEYEKGVHDLIAALPAIRALHPGTSLSIVGTGTQLSWLEDLAVAHKVSRAVRFFGALDPAGIQRHMRSSSALVVPSRYEPFGLVALEGAATGIPLVAASTGGLAETVIENVTGRSFPHGDTEELIAAVHRCLSSPSRSARMATTARQRITQSSDWKTIAHHTHSLYLQTKRHVHREPFDRPQLSLPVRLLHLGP